MRARVALAAADRRHEAETGDAEHFVQLSARVEAGVQALAQQGQQDAGQQTR